MNCRLLLNVRASGDLIYVLIGDKFGKVYRNIYVKTSGVIRAILVVFGAFASGGAFAGDAQSSDLDRLLKPSGPLTKTVDIYGQALLAEGLRDRLAVVTFVSAGCMILCVTRTLDLDRLARDLPGSLRGRVVFLAIDTDPAADDAQRLRAFADSLLGPEAQLRFLPSDAEATKSVAKDLNYPAASLPEPPPTVLLFDRRGRVAMSYGGAPLDAMRLARDLAVLDTFTQGLGRPPAETEPTR